MPSEAVMPTATQPGCFELRWFMSSTNLSEMGKADSMVKVLGRLPVAELLKRYPQIRKRTVLCLVPLRSDTKSSEPARYECHLSQFKPTNLHRQEYAGFFDVTATHTLWDLSQRLTAAAPQATAAVAPVDTASAGQKQIAHQVRAATHTV